MQEWGVSAGRVAAVEYSPDGQTLYAGGSRGLCVAGWDVHSREPGVQHRHDKEILCLTVSADGTVVASADKGGALRLWNAGTRELRNLLLAEPPGVVAVALTPDLSGLAAAGVRAYWWSDPLKPRARRARRFDEDLIPWRGHAVAVTTSPDGRWLAAAAGGRHPYYVMRRLHGRKAGWTRETGSVQASGFRFTADGRWMAVLLGRVVELHEMQEAPWHPAGFTPVMRTILQGHEGPVRGFAFHPNGTRLVTVSTDGTARLWSVPGGKQVRSWDWAPDKLSAVAFAPDGLTCAAGGANGRATVWGLEG
jgi:WD40 repeat protein